MGRAAGLRRQPPGHRPAPRGGGAARRDQRRVLHPPRARQRRQRLRQRPGRPVDYDKALNDCVAFLRAEAGRDPCDKELSDLVGELSTRSEDFRLRWAAHDVRYHRTGRKRFHHPIVGDLELDYEAFELPCDPGQRLNIYTAPPDSPSAEALSLLASWSARQPVTTPAATGADGA
ncbi:MAG: MmyB family transcriptional regulator [Nocardioidaceae bacterium]